MLKALIVVTAMGVISGCVSGSAMTDYEQQLQWVIDANPQQDAEAAMAKGDFRLMAMATRGITIPGVDNDLSAKYELKCGINRMPGVTDVIRSQKQMELIKKAHSYALKYNAIIKTRCKI